MVEEARVAHISSGALLENQIDADRKPDGQLPQDNIFRYVTQALTRQDHANSRASQTPFRSPP